MFCVPVLYPFNFTVYLVSWAHPLVPVRASCVVITREPLSLSLFLITFISNELTLASL